jgi:hypothetical protein
MLTLYHHLEPLYSPCWATGVAMPNLKRPPRVLMRERKGRRCELPDCEKFVHSLSRYC